MSNYEQKEKTIKDIRTIEASKKQFIGMDGKLGLIVKYLGDPIMQDPFSYATILEDPFDLTEVEYERTLSGQNGPVIYRNEELIADEGAGSADEENPNFLGYIFDGLSRGMHIEIKYTRFDNEIKVYFKGHEVYCEVAGELEKYIPFDEWESMIERLHLAAKQKTKKNKESEKQELIENAKKLKNSFWQKIKNTWGIQ